MGLSSATLGLDRSPLQTSGMFRATLDGFARREQRREHELADARGACLELRRERDEAVAMHVARRAHAAADAASQREAQLQEVVTRYERRLAQTECWADSPMSEARSAAAKEAQAAAAAAAAKAERYRQRAQRQKEQKARATRRTADCKALLKAQGLVTARSRRALLTKALLAAWRSQAADSRRLARWEACAQGQTDGLTAARQKSELACIFVTWASCAAAARHERALRAELAEVDMRTTVAIGRLRAELRWARQRHRAQALAAQDAKAKVSLGLAFRAWCVASAASRSEVWLRTQLDAADASRGAAETTLRAELSAAKLRRRDTALAAVFARGQVAAGAALRAWSAAARAAWAESAMSRELAEQQAGANLALASARAEARALRRQRRTQGEAALQARGRAAVATALSTWLREARALQAARQLSTALEDSEFRHQRALSLHRSQARAAREAARRAGLAVASGRGVATLRVALAVWRSIRLHGRSALASRSTAEARVELQRTAALSCAIDAWRIAAAKSAAEGLAAQLQEARQQAKDSNSRAAGAAASSAALLEEVGRARRAGSRAGQAVARRAWSTFAFRGAQRSLELLVFCGWAQATGSVEAPPPPPPEDIEERVEAERLRTRAAGEVAQQALTLAWPPAGRSLGRLDHWRAAAFEAWWWAVVRPRCDLTDLDHRCQQPYEVRAPQRAPEAQPSTQYDGSAPLRRKSKPSPSASKRRSQRPGP